MIRIILAVMKLINANGKIKVNHPDLPTPAPTSPLPAPKLMLEKKKKKA
jgi:hypothetical protein